jgi:hypothetical protein
MQLLRSLFGSRGKEQKAQTTRAVAPTEITAAAAPEPFRIVDHFWGHEGLPILDWQAVERWSSSSSDPNVRRTLKGDCQRAWLLHLRDALGGTFELHESQECLVVAPYTRRSATVMLDFVSRTRARIAATLDGLTQPQMLEKQILVVFADADTYYRYVSHAYPTDGEFSFSSGMFLHAGCPHFVTVHQDDMHTIERIIAHELTHASVAHLPIPLWLNEGLAVNTEDRLMGRVPKLFTPTEMRRKHLAFWGAAEIQEFWSGRSFHRPDDGNLLSYDLAQVLIEILAADWPRFRAFALAAHYEDAGAAAAHEHLEIDLGESVASLFEKDLTQGWHPDPRKWEQAVEHTPQ